MVKANRIVVLQCCSSAMARSVCLAGTLLLATLLCCGEVCCRAAARNKEGSPLGEDPEVNYDAIQLIRYNGYPAQAHWVKTSDGYILGLHRIPYGRNQKDNGSRPVIFLQHGLLCSSTNWLTNLYDESLAYLLADAGFDVWMGNVRGNTYSRNHTSLSPKDKAFWDFTFDQHALIDLPYMIDYVRANTTQDKLFYVGHSQGTVMGFAGFSANKTLASKILAFFALAPITTLKDISGGFRFLAEKYLMKVEKEILDLLGHGEFLPNDELMKILAQFVCPFDREVEDICEDVIFIICGYDKSNINITRLPVYYSHTPAGTSVLNLVHYAQEVDSGIFQMFKYSTPAENAAHYNGMTTPPLYNTSELSVPTALFSGGNDTLADLKDVAHLVSVLKPGVVFNHTFVAKYDHLDFIWGLDANSTIYVPIINLITSGAWRSKADGR